MTATTKYRITEYGTTVDWAASYADAVDRLRIARRINPRAAAHIEMVEDVAENTISAPKHDTPRERATLADLFLTETSYSLLRLPSELLTTVRDVLLDHGIKDWDTVDAVTDILRERAEIEASYPAYNPDNPATHTACGP